MKIKIIRIDKSLPLPEYHTEGAVAFDMYCRIDTTVATKAMTLLPSNIIIEVPRGHTLIIASRSSTPRKKSLMPPHGIGIIDRDYHGPNDEIGILVYNFSDNPVTVQKGERIAQGLIVPVERAEWEEAESIKDQSRGGFGSTG